MRLISIYVFLSQILIFITMLMGVYKTLISVYFNNKAINSHSFLNTGMIVIVMVVKCDLSRFNTIIVEGLQTVITDKALQEH